LTVLSCSKETNRGEHFLLTHIKIRPGLRAGDKTAFDHGLLSMMTRELLSDVKPDIRE